LGSLHDDHGIGFRNSIAPVELAGPHGDLQSLFGDCALPADSRARLRHADADSGRHLAVVQDAGRASAHALSRHADGDHGAGHHQPYRAVDQPVGRHLATGVADDDGRVGREGLFPRRHRPIPVPFGKKPGSDPGFPTARPSTQACLCRTCTAGRTRPSPSSG